MFSALYNWVYICGTNAGVILISLSRDRDYIRPTDSNLRAIIISEDTSNFLDKSNMKLYCVVEWNSKTSLVLPKTCKHYDINILFKSQ